MKLHHIGFLTTDISAQAKHLCDSCGYEIVSEIIEDPVQTANVQFLKLAGTNTFLELVSPNSEESKLSKALKKGGGLHHVCYQTDDILADLKNFRDNGFLTICEPVEARAFKGRKIAWVMDAKRSLIELVESHGAPHAELSV